MHIGLLCFLEENVNWGLLYFLEENVNWNKF